jgi:hypothetical protein
LRLIAEPLVTLPAPFQGGAATWILGLALHIFIALSMAAVYYAASRKLPFLMEYPLIRAPRVRLSTDLIRSVCQRDDFPKTLRQRMVLHTVAERASAVFNL